MYKAKDANKKKSQPTQTNVINGNVSQYGKVRAKPM